MTQNQIEILAILHDRGISHSKIADMLEVPMSAVRKACAQIDQERMAAGEQYAVCKECGRKIVYERKTRPRLFCCRKCMLTWWNKRRYTSGRPSDDHRQCQFCGKEFIVNKSSSQKYCSPECYHKWRRENHPKADYSLEEKIYTKCAVTQNI